MAAYNIKDMVGTSTVKGRKEYQKSATLLKDFQMSGCLGCTRFKKKKKNTLKGESKAHTEAFPNILVRRDPRLLEIEGLNQFWN